MVSRSETGVPRTSHRRGKDTMSSTFHVRGGSPLDGEITVRGAKNLVSKAMVAALLGEAPSVLRSVPDISDVRIVSNLLSIHGVKVENDIASGTLRLDPSNVERAHVADIDAHAGSSRIPILFCGPLLHRLGEAIIPDLGGCRIGDRPINYHLDVLRSFGAVVDKREMGIYITAPNGLRGTKIHLEYPSVGATEQVLLTAVRALAGRIEAGSWACAALVTGGDVFVRGAEQKPMATFLNVFRRVGGGIEIREDGIRFLHPGTPLKAIALETDVHPGFMTDWQQP